MRIINIISQVLFYMGLLLKLFHIHYNAILILIGLVGVVISLIVGVLKKQQKATLLLTLANFGWLLLVFVSVKFLPIQSVILIVAALLTLVAAVFIIRAGHPKRLLPILITIPIALFFYFLPTHERYRILCINWNYEIETDYITWDKYSGSCIKMMSLLKHLKHPQKPEPLRINLKTVIGCNSLMHIMKL